MFRKLALACSSICCVGRCSLVVDHQMVDHFLGFVNPDDPVGRGELSYLEIYIVTMMIELTSNKVNLQVTKLLSYLRRTNQVAV